MWKHILEKEVSNSVLEDCTAASFLWLWDSWSHLHYSTMDFFLWQWGTAFYCTSLNCSNMNEVTVNLFCVLFCLFCFWLLNVDYIRLFETYLNGKNAHTIWKVMVYELFSCIGWKIYCIERMITFGLGLLCVFPPVSVYLVFVLPALLVCSFLDVPCESISLCLALRDNLKCLLLFLPHWYAWILISYLFAFVCFLVFDGFFFFVFSIVWIKLAIVSPKSCLPCVFAFGSPSSFPLSVTHTKLSILQCATGSYLCTVQIYKWERKYQI